MTRRFALVCLLVLLAGCGPGPLEDDSRTTNGDVCRGAENLGLAGLGSDFEDRTWSADEVVVSYALGSGADVLLVASVNGSRAGVEPAVASGDSGVVVDADGIDLGERLDGRHDVNVVMYGDADRDGEFDADVDAPCRTDGSVVQTGTRVLNFS